MDTVRRAGPCGGTDWSRQLYPRTVQGDRCDRPAEWGEGVRCRLQYPGRRVADVLKYAIARGAPKDRLAMGLAGYGYDWTRKPAATLSWAGWQKRPRSSGAIDPASGEMVIGKATFSGAKSAEAKISLAKSLQ